MAVATYHRDAGGVDLVQLQGASGEGVQEAVHCALAVRTTIGHPTLEVQRDDGLSLSLSTDGARAFLVLVGPDGTSRSSVGAAADGPVMVFDYRGSWSEAASRQTVALGIAVEALVQFVERGHVEPDVVQFASD